MNMAMNIWGVSVSVYGVVLLASLLASLLQLLIFFSPISSPDQLQLPSLLSPDLRASPWNNYLKEVTKLGEGTLKNPEDVCVDNEGNLYTATRDGWIKKMHKNGTWEDWKLVGGDSLLGITASVTISGDILLCDGNKGLLKVNQVDGVTILSSEVNGSKIRFADDVIEASDGSIYFSDASTKYGFHEWYLDFLEAKPYGRLLKYNPSTKETSVLIDGLYFANGVALSMDQDFVVVCESWRFRCLKYWLKGETEGKIEIFIDNLPGGPDNINLAPDGSFWIALLQLTRDGFDFVHKWKTVKHILATFPKLMNLLRGTNSRAMAVNVGADAAGNGNYTIIRKFDDGDGKVMSFVTSVLEFDGHLYLGSLQSTFVGKLQLSRKSTH